MDKQDTETLIQVADILSQGTVEFCDHCGHGNSVVPVDPAKLKAAIIVSAKLHHGALALRMSQDGRDVGSKAYNSCWNALRNIFPECFEDPKKYDLFKTMGLNIWHTVFASVFEVMYMDYSPEDFTNQEKYTELIKNLLVKNDSVTRDGIPISDHRYWLTGNPGQHTIYREFAPGAREQRITGNSLSKSLGERSHKKGYGDNEFDIIYD